MMNHKPKEVLVQVLRGAGASEELVNTAKTFQCESCRMSDEKPRTHPVSAPPPYEFNHTVPVDVPETADYVGHKYSWLNMVDVGTSYQAVVTLVRVGGGQPSSSKCFAEIYAALGFTFRVAQGGLSRQRATQPRGVRARVV